jgi:hypothetical protein
MQPSVNVPRLDGGKWVYATLSVRDGDRPLKPTHVGFDRVRFSEPPKLTGNPIEIIITNGDAVQRQMAEVLPHDPEATRIPIRLVSPR